MTELVVYVPYDVTRNGWDSIREYAVEHGIDLSRPHRRARDADGSYRIAQERPYEGLFKGDFI